jgi:hypothetical protein
MKYLFPLLLAFYGVAASAQWAVYDQLVKEQLSLINENSNSAARELTKLPEMTEISKKFETVSIADRAKFIGTEEDCGDSKLNPKHAIACQGLRNLRLKTLEQSEAMLGSIKKRREDISALVSASRGSENSAGRLQRYQFELQGLQAQMQNDAMQLQVLMDGYKQREKIYEMQMAEARRSTDTRKAGAASLGAVPFVMK